jgi:hypothetical protein
MLSRRNILYLNMHNLCIRKPKYSGGTNRRVIVIETLIILTYFRNTITLIEYISMKHIHNVEIII